MFTGIIEGFGTIKGTRSSSGQGMRLSIQSDFELDKTKIGDSIAVNGACLTVVTLSNREFEVDVAPETVARTTFSKLKIGTRVNLERALRLSDRLDGHIVSGHIDGTAVIKEKKNLGNAIIVSFIVPESLSKYMIKKGSVAIDGISLTINNCSKTSFDVSIIPHTLQLTTIGFKKPGDHVNIETDMIGKYVEKFVLLNPENSSFEEKKHSSSIDMKFLGEAGFL